MERNNVVLLPDRESDDAQLIERLKAGQDDAFQLLFRRQAPRVYRLAAVVLGSPSAAEDAVQEVFLRVFRSIASYRGDAKLSTWLHRITVNVCLSELRRRERTASREDAAARGALAKACDLSASDARLDLLPLLGRLDFTRRVTIVLHHCEGLSAREIAEVMGESRDAVLKRLQRTRAELLEQLGNDDTPEGRASAELATDVAEGGGTGT